jgi:hypothetical protein
METVDCPGDDPIGRRKDLTAGGVVLVSGTLTITRFGPDGDEEANFWAGTSSCWFSSRVSPPQNVSHVPPKGSES